MNDSDEGYNGDKHPVKSSSISNDEAKKMIDNFKDKKNKYKFENYVWSSFSKERMLNICQDPNVLELKFFVGVFLDDGDPKKKDAPTIILQLKKTATALDPAYEYQQGDSYCPPPNDSSCGSVEST